MMTRTHELTTLAFEADNWDIAKRLYEGNLPAVELLQSNASVSSADEDPSLRFLFTLSYLRLGDFEKASKLQPGGLTSPKLSSGLIKISRLLSVLLVPPHIAGKP